MAISQAHRGRSLELAIETANAAYRARGLAVVQRIAVPTKALPDRRGGIRVIREKSTVDFVGVTAPGGRMVAFDAKQNRTATRFDLDRRWGHEVEFIRAVTGAGGIGFLLVEQVTQCRCYIVPGPQLVELWDEAQGGGRKSIPLGLLESFPVAGPGRGVAIDWLSTLEKEGMI